MTKLLTTGQMIDKLKVGEVAESEKMLKFDNYVYVVRKTETGSIMTLDCNFKETGHYIPLQGDIINLKWTIKPNYVSFDEAMKALNVGTSVAFCHDSVGYDIELETDISFLFDQTEFTFEDLLRGKWTIEGDAE